MPFAAARQGPPRARIGALPVVRRWAIGIVMVCAASSARAGKYFDPGAGSPTRLHRTPADCGRGRWPAQDATPGWARLHWSVAAGAVVTGGGAGIVVPEVGYALWSRDWLCDSGGGWFRDHLWQRWSLAVTADAAFRTGDTGFDMRPALRLARSHLRRGFLSFGTEWVPSTELFVSVGPTFAPAFTGAAVGLGGRLAIVALELRLTARTDDRGHEVALLLGLTDLHGLWRIGPRRSTSPPEPAQRDRWWQRLLRR